jgi:hypothetical protein
MKTAWTWIKAIITAALAFLGLAALVISGRRKKHEEAAGRAEGEADRVEKAGERGDAQEILDSFRRGTEK